METELYEREGGQKATARGEVCAQQARNPAIKLENLVLGWWEARNWDR